MKEYNKAEEPTTISRKFSCTRILEIKLEMKHDPPSEKEPYSSMF